MQRLVAVDGLERDLDRHPDPDRVGCDAVGSNVIRQTTAYTGKSEPTRSIWRMKMPNSFSDAGGI